MLLFPNCKINLGLSVTGKSDNGFHTLETVMYPVPLNDVLEIIISPSGKFSFEMSGLQIPGNSDDNLVVKAYKLLKEDFNLDAVAIHLLKTIPMGSGLGGGSADGAFAIKLLNSLFNLSLTTKRMQHYAAKLGSDCPFFIENRPVLAKGRGDVFENVEVDLKGYYIKIVKPEVHINTGEAYSLIKPSIPAVPIKEIIGRPIEHWKGILANDFEKPVFQNYPEIMKIKEKLYDAGAVFASMSGSGSAVYGIFKEMTGIAEDFKDCFVWEGIL